MSHDHSVTDAPIEPARDPGEESAQRPNSAPFDDDLFGDDYLYFYRDYPTGEETAIEIELIGDLLDEPTGARVLDLACGFGRMTLPLAARGWAMTGLDRSRVLLDEARRRSSARSLPIEWVHGDMRQLAFDQEFDAVLSWFTSFGYYADDDLAAILAGAFRALRPGGKLMLESLNRDQLLRDFQSHFVLEHNGDFLIDENRFDALTDRTHHQRTVLRDAQARTYEWQLRHYSVPEIRSWLLRAGFANVEAFGEDAAVFSVDSNRLILIAHRAP